MVQNILEFEPTKDDLDHLREWISKSPHLIQDYDDNVLSAFVRGCKGSLQKAKKVLEAFNAIGQRYPELFQNYDPLDPHLLDHLSVSCTFTLPKKTPDGSIVYMAVPREEEGFKSDPYKSHGPEFFRYWLLSLYIHIWKNDFGPGKWIIIIDGKESNFTRMRELTPVIIKQWVDVMQNALPIRVQAFHLLNLAPFMQQVFNIGKSMAKKKIADRIYFHSSMRTLYELLPKEILPKEYGGGEDSVLILHERWFKTVQSFRNKFLEEESKMRKLDPLRPKTDKNEVMVGTFKALTVD